MPELDIQGIFAALDREDIEFLVIGGVAVGFHGFVRGTKDVDIVPNPEPENLARLAAMLAALDAQIEGADEFKGEELPDEPLWEKLSPTAIEAEIGGLPVKFASYESLVALKEQAGRPQDLIDLQRLREARGEE